MCIMRRNSGLYSEVPFFGLGTVVVYIPPPVKNSKVRSTGSQVAEKEMKFKKWGGLRSAVLAQGNNLKM